MIQLSHIRARINALRRKFALEISVVRLRPMAEEYCQEWSVAAIEGQTAPDDLAFIRKVGARIRLPTFMAAHQYLQQCLDQKIVPGVEHLLGALLPWAVLRGLVVLADDPPPTPAPQSA